jgi:hypothetical protein
VADEREADGRGADGRGADERGAERTIYIIVVAALAADIALGAALTVLYG